MTFPYGVILKYSDGAVPRLTRGTGGEPVVTLPVPSPSNVPYAVPAVAGDVIVPFEDGSWVKEAGDRLEFRVMVDGRVRARELNPWEVVLRDDRVPHCKAALREAVAYVPTASVMPARSA